MRDVRSLAVFVSRIVGLVGSIVALAFMALLAIGGFAQGNAWMVLIGIGGAALLVAIWRCLPLYLRRRSSRD